MATESTGQPSSLRARREAIVRAHMDSEDRHVFEETVATFASPRYEVVPTGEVFAGPEAVLAFLRETGAAFPNFHFAVHGLHHTDKAVIAEVEFIGTHAGPWRGLPATGRDVRYRMCNVFEFEDDRLICERLYFDRLGILIQLGIARDPTTFSGRVAAFMNHPLTVVRAWLRGWARK